MKYRAGHTDKTGGLPQNKKTKEKQQHSTMTRNKSKSNPSDKGGY